MNKSVGVTDVHIGAQFLASIYVQHLFLPKNHLEASDNLDLLNSGIDELEQRVLTLECQMREITSVLVGEGNGVDVELQSAKMQTRRPHQGSYLPRLIQEE